MRYSIQDDEVSKIVSLEEVVAANIGQLCQKFVEEITIWGKKFNSQLVLDISKKTVGMINDDLYISYNSFSTDFDNTGASFFNISERYYIGDDALQKVKSIQQDILDTMCSHSSLEIAYECEGDSKYSTELINEYKEIISRFISKIDSAYEDNIMSARDIGYNNILGNSLEILVKYQYDTLINISYLYHTIFDTFLEWYDKTVKENATLLEEIACKLIYASQENHEEEIEKVLSQILEGNIVNSGTSSASLGNIGQGNSKPNEENSYPKEMIKQAIASSTDALIKELDTQEKIHNFKQYIRQCQRQFDECKSETNDKEKQSKFQKFCEFIKDGAKKYSKPIAKALGIIVPLIAPKGHIVSKIAKSLPDIMQCFSGISNEKKDMDKDELGLDCMKSIGVDKLPENPDEIKKYIEDNSEKIASDILKKILSSEKYMKILDIDENELSKQENREVYKKATGKELARVPEKRKAYDYNFEQYNPKKLNSLCPIENEEKVNLISEDIGTNLAEKFSCNSMEKITGELQKVKHELDSSRAYVQLIDDTELKRLIDEIRGIISTRTESEILENYEGRYNKEDIRMLFDEFESEKKKSEAKKIDPNYKRACKNFVRRQMGYPAKEEESVVVKDIKELIPVINSKCPSFIVEDKKIITLINNAQNLVNQKNGNIKRKGILKTLWDNTTILGGTLGIGVLLALGGCWPLGVLYSWTSIGSVISDNYSSAYSNLAYQLGDKRTDFLIDNYMNTENNKFSLVKKHK